MPSPDLRANLGMVQHTISTRSSGWRSKPGPTFVSGLDEALAFAKNDLKLDTTNTRFNAYRTRLDALERSRQQYGDGVALEGFLAEIEVNAVALTESQELMAVVAFLRTVPLDRAKKKLQIVLKGPDASRRRRKLTNPARNTMFELNLARDSVGPG